VFAPPSGGTGRWWHAVVELAVEGDEGAGCADEGFAVAAGLGGVALGGAGFVVVVFLDDAADAVEDAAGAVDDAEAELAAEDGFEGVEAGGDVGAGHPLGEVGEMEVVARGDAGDALAWVGELQDDLGGGFGRWVEGLGLPVSERCAFMGDGRGARSDGER